MINKLTIYVEEAHNGFVVTFGNTSMPTIYEHPDSVRNAVDEELNEWLGLVLEAALEEPADAS